MKRQRDELTAPEHQPVTKRTTYRAVAVSGADQQPYRQLKVEDALAYLDKVKRQFGEQPYIYNQFLDIMKNFKAQTIDTPGVIKRVSELFKGHNSLILGFNTFLPPGYKIEVVHETIPNPRPVAAAPQRRAAAPRRTSEHGQPLEFDHAISYVTKIKRRFVNDPNTYKAFLDILHTYQKQQRSIKDVLEKVSHLFRDHPDLLQDFTYFLPDAVQPQVEQILRQNKVKGITPRSRRGPSGRRKPDKDLRDDHALARAEREKARRRARRERQKRNDEPLSVSLPPSEKSFFQKIKSSLGSRERWQEFLKCLDLYAREVITKAELLTLVSDVFGTKHTALMDDFKLMLNTRGMLDSQAEDVWYSLPVAEIDFSKCRQCTPSYRALPDTYPKFATSERTVADAAVLNDTWVSVPTGSEDFSFKSMRKNQYEEALFKCEDERYEVDMVIENNAAAIRVLEPLAEEIAALQAAEPTVWQFRLDSRSLGVLHLKAISRIYGDHGAEMLELLRRNPAGAIPIILKRLKEKDAEWKKVKTQLNKNWKEVLERNYHKSLDHRSFYFKQADKKAVSSKHMLADIRSRADTEREAGSGAPHLVMDHPDTGVHEDVANVMAYAVDKLHSNNDKERVAGLWGSFVERMFRFPPCWSFGESGGSKEINIGTTVITPYGVGTVENIRRPDPYSGSISFVVRLPWGRSVLQPDAVKPANASPPRDGEAADADRCRPGASIYYGGVHTFHFFRLHAMVMQRLATAKKLCATARKRRVAHPADRVADSQRKKEEASGNNGTDSSADGDVTMDGDEEEPPRDASSEDLYKYYLTALYSTIDGTMDSSKYEDECRTLMGTSSYLLFTLDKVISAAVKQLVAMVNDATDRKMRAEYNQYLLTRASRGDRLTTVDEQALARDYRSTAALHMADSHEECFYVRYEVSPSSDGQQGRLELSFLGHALATLTGGPVKTFAYKVNFPFERDAAAAAATSNGAGAGAGSGSGVPAGTAAGAAGTTVA